MKRSIDDVLADLRGAAERQIRTPDLYKVALIGRTGPVRRAPARRWWWGAALALMALLAIGGGLVRERMAAQVAASYRTPVPKGFWPQASQVGVGAYVRIFPRKAGQRNCLIPIGHPVPHGPRTLRGTCSTEVVNREVYLSLLPPSGGVFRNSAGVIASGAVVLTQYWPGPWFQTNVVRWIFPIDAKGRVMGMEYVGNPPQFPK